MDKKIFFLLQRHRPDALHSRHRSQAPSRRPTRRERVAADDPLLPGKRDDRFRFRFRFEVVLAAHERLEPNPGHQVEAVRCRRTVDGPPQLRDRPDSLLASVLRFSGLLLHLVRRKLSDALPLVKEGRALQAGRLHGSGPGLPEKLRGSRSGHEVGTGRDVFVRDHLREEGLGREGQVR